MPCCKYERQSALTFFVLFFLALSLLLVKVQLSWASANTQGPKSRYQNQNKNSPEAASCSCPPTPPTGMGRVNRNCLVSSCLLALEVKGNQPVPWGRGRPRVGASFQRPPVCKGWCWPGGRLLPTWELSGLSPRKTNLLTRSRIHIN